MANHPERDRKAMVVYEAELVPEVYIYSVPNDITHTLHTSHGLHMHMA